jgi:hypothetical protein
MKRKSVFLFAAILLLLLAFCFSPVSAYASNPSKPADSITAVENDHVINLK